MGTRNITRVVQNGEVKINQYCQWDGYPTGHGLNVLEFMKEILFNDKLGAFLSVLSKCKLVYAEDGETGTYTGAPYEKKIWDKMKTISDYGADYKAICEAVEKRVVTIEEAKYLAVASRDVGSEVLRFMMVYAPDGMTFYTDEYLSEITDDLDWQIEGMFTINLDDECVEINYHGNIKFVTFNEIKKLSEEELESRMLKFERE